MPRARKTQSGDPAQKIKSVPGQRYGEGVAQQQMQQVMPAPDRVANNVPATTNVRLPNVGAPIRPSDGAVPPAVLDYLSQLSMNTLRQPTSNAKPITNGLSSGPGAGPEVVQSFMRPAPAMRMLQKYAELTNDPTYVRLLQNFNL